MLQASHKLFVLPDLYNPWYSTPQNILFMLCGFSFLHPNLWLRSQQPDTTLQYPHPSLPTNHHRFGWISLLPKQFSKWCFPRDFPADGEHKPWADAEQQILLPNPEPWLLEQCQWDVKSACLSLNLPHSQSKHFLKPVPPSFPHPARSLVWQA